MASVTFVSRSEAMANFKETLEGRQDLFRDAPDSVLRDRFKEPMMRRQATIMITAAKDISPWENMLEVKNLEVREFQTT